MCFICDKQKSRKRLFGVKRSKHFWLGEKLRVAFDIGKPIFHSPCTFHFLISVSPSFLSYSISVSPSLSPSPSPSSSPFLNSISLPIAVNTTYSNCGKRMQRKKLLTLLSQSRQSAKLFFQSSGVSPHPLVRGGGAHSLAGEGLGESLFRRGDIHCGALCI
jgi:hypothetical protein